MLKASTRITILLLGVAAVMPVGAVQRAPNLSGEWILVSATTTASRPGREDAESYGRGEIKTMANTVNGVAFNCGIECALAQHAQTLIVDKAMLGSETKSAPALTLQLNGRETSVVNSFTPSDPALLVTAQWKGDTLEIATAGAHGATQTLSIQSDQLVVVTRMNRPSAPRLTLTYKRK